MLYSHTQNTGRASGTRNLNHVRRLAVGCMIALLCPSHGFAQDDGGFKYIEIKVLDPEGKPLADANVEVSMDGVDFPMPTDEEGIASLNVPSKIERSLMLGVRQDGYAAVGARWGQGDKVPDELTINVEKGFPIGGIVHDEEGNPIEGVEIEASMSSGNTKPGELRPWFSGLIATTDSEGRWRTETAPEKELQIHWRIRHPDYIQDDVYGRHRATWQQLQSLDHVFTLKKGIEIRGTVADADGKPIAGAKVAAGADRFGGSNFVTAETDDAGEYVVKNVQAGSTVLTTFAEGWAPDLRSIVASREAEPVEIVLQSGHSIRVRVTDPEGEPISSVWIAPDTWRGHRSIGGVMPRIETDADGVWKSESFPEDAVDCDILKQGHMSVRNQKLISREEEYVIVMPNPLVVQGKVVDAESGKPIEEFQVVQGMNWDNSNRNTHWERYNVKTSQDGEYRTQFDEPRFEHLVRIEAAGYRPGISRAIKSDEGEVTIDFELETGTGPSGVVKTPIGEPAKGAVAVMAVVDQHVQINNGEYRQSDAQNVKTDADGRFELPFPDNDYLVVFLHESGWQQIDGKALEKGGEVTLEEWAQVEGKMLQGDEPLDGERVFINFMTRHQQGQPNVYWSNYAETAADGTFAFARVRAGEATAGRNITYGDGTRFQMGAYTHSEPLELTPGKTTQVQIGGAGNSLKGRLVVPDDYEGEVFWNMGVVQFSEQAQRPALNNPLQALGKAIAQIGQIKPAASQPPKPAFRRSYAAAIAEDGTYELHDIRPGQYMINVRLLKPPTGEVYRWDPVATYSQAVTIPEPKDGDEPIDLGDQKLTMVAPKPQPGGGGAIPVAPSPN